MILSYSLWGRSMGAVTAIRFAGEYCSTPIPQRPQGPPLRALILDSPFAHLYSLAQHVVESFHLSSPAPKVVLSGVAAIGLPLTRSAILQRIPGFDIATFENLNLAAKCAELDMFCFHGELDYLYFIINSSLLFLSVV